MGTQTIETTSTDAFLEPRHIDVVALVSQVESIDVIDYASRASEIDASCKRVGIKTFLDKPLVLAAWARAKYWLGQYHDSLSLSENAEKLFRQSGGARQIYDERLFQVTLYLALSDLDSAEATLKSARAGSPQDRSFQMQLLVCGFRIAYSKGDLVLARSILSEISQLQNSVAEVLNVRVLSALLDHSEKSFTHCVSESFFDVEANNPFELQVPPNLHQSMVAARLRLAQLLAVEGHTVRARHLLVEPNLCPSSQRPQGALATALVFAGEKRFESAFDCLNLAGQAGFHGLSIGETALLSWYRALVGLVALKDEDSFAHVEKTVALIKASKGGGLVGRTLLLYAFVRFKRGDRDQAISLLEQAFTTDDAQSGVSIGTRTVVAELLGCPEEGEPGRFIPRASFLAVALLCNAHPPALGLLVNRFSMSAIPTEFFDLIDTKRVFKDEHAFSVVAKSVDKQALKIRLAANIPPIEAGEPKGDKPYYIRLLGNLNIEHNGCDIDISTWRKSKSRELFLSVLLQAGSDISREQIIETLWPDMSPEKARNNYYVTWSNLKRILQGGDSSRKETLPIKSSGSRCYVDRSHCGVDIIDMVDSIHKGHRAASLGDLGESVQHYQTTAELYRGDLLPGDMYNEWLASHREYYHTMFIEAMISATKISLELNNSSGAIFFIERALRVEQSREVLYEWAMRTYLHADRREDAIEMYHLCRKHLSEELGLDPSTSLKSLYAEVINS